MYTNMFDQSGQPCAGRPSCATDVYIVHDAGDLHFAAGGDRHNSYCKKPGCETSRYQLRRTKHAEFYQFSVLADGRMIPAYCLEKGGEGPERGTRYTSIPIKRLGDIDDAVCGEIAYILGNFYPAVGAVECLERLGAEPRVCAALDENDVYAIVQTALWGVMKQVSADQVVFLQCCNTSQKHPKSDLMCSLVRRLMAMAYSCAEYSGRSGTPYIAFSGCPDEVRLHHGQWMVGPFTICSSFRALPQVSIEPCNRCDVNPSWIFTDCQGNPIAKPAMNQAFYLLIRHDGKPVCLQMTVSASERITEVIALASDDCVHQKLGTARPILHRVSNSICFCVDAPGRDKPGCPSCHPCDRAPYRIQNKPEECSEPHMMPDGRGPKMCTAKLVECKQCRKKSEKNYEKVRKFDMERNGEEKYDGNPFELKDADLRPGLFDPRGNQMERMQPPGQYYYNDGMPYGMKDADLRPGMFDPRGNQMERMQPPGQYYYNGGMPYGMKDADLRPGMFDPRGNQMERMQPPKYDHEMGREQTCRKCEEDGYIPYALEDADLRPCMTMASAEAAEDAISYDRVESDDAAPEFEEATSVFNDRSSEFDDVTPVFDDVAPVSEEYDTEPALETASMLTNADEYPTGCQEEILSCAASAAENIEQAEKFCPPPVPRYCPRIKWPETME